MARDKKKKDDGLPPVPGWVVTYGDMMSLLLTFFVLLLSFSTISENDFNNAMMSLQGAFGVLEGFDSPLTLVPRTPRNTPRNVERLARSVQRAVQVMGLDEDVKVRFDESGGLRVTLPSGVLFDSGSAALRPASYPLLRDVSELLGELPELFIEVRGHSDNRPVGNTSAYVDNYELSYWRADAVARRISDVGNIPLQQFEVVACGDGQPIATNETPEGRAANRRVELHVRGMLDRNEVQDLREEFEALPQEVAAPAPGAP